MIDPNRTSKTDPGHEQCACSMGERVRNLNAELQAAHGAIDEARSGKFAAGTFPDAIGSVSFYTAGDLSRIDDLNAFPLTYPIGASPDGR